MHLLKTLEFVIELGCLVGSGQLPLIVFVIDSTNLYKHKFNSNQHSDQTVILEPI
jgi:hypothetical protein